MTALAGMPDGAQIKARPRGTQTACAATMPDSLIPDEYSLMDLSAWDEKALSLLDNDGDAIFIFTPKRKNHA